MNTPLVQKVTANILITLKSGELIPVVANLEFTEDDPAESIVLKSWDSIFEESNQNGRDFR